MNESRYLEEFRYNEYLGIYFAVMSDSINPKVEMTFNQYAMHAFNSLSDDINDLENQKNFVNNGRRTLPSIALFYLSLEAFINSLCKVVSYVFGKDPNLPIKKDICSKLNFLFTELKYDQSEIRKLGIYNRVNEFRQFRNELFHDRNTGEEIKFKKTKFSSLPVFSNQVDTFQAFLIFIEVVILFRYSFKGLDIMPNTPIGSSNIIYFDKLDNLYNKYLKPYFEQTLLKQNLETKLNLNINSFVSLLPNDPIYQGEIIIVSRIKQDIRFEHSLNQTITSM